MRTLALTSDPPEHRGAMSVLFNCAEDSALWTWRCRFGDYEMRLAGDAVGEDSNERVTNGESTRTGSH